MDFIIQQDPEVMGGAPCFGQTRVPIQTFFDYLEAGDSLEVFLQHFPTVTREQAVALLESAKHSLLKACLLKLKSSMGWLS